MTLYVLKQKDFISPADVIYHYDNSDINLFKSPRYTKYCQKDAHLIFKFVFGLLFVLRIFYIIFIHINLYFEGGRFIDHNVFYLQLMILIICLILEKTAMTNKNVSPFWWNLNLNSRNIYMISEMVLPEFITL